MGQRMAHRTKRLWSDEEKRTICFQTTTLGVSVAQVASYYAMNANMVSNGCATLGMRPIPKRSRIWRQKKPVSCRLRLLVRPGTMTYLRQLTLYRRKMRLGSTLPAVTDFGSMVPMMPKADLKKALRRD